MARLKGWRYNAFIGTFVGVWLLTIYPVVISPMLNPEPYKANRAQIKFKPRDE